MRRTPDTLSRDVSHLEDQMFRFRTELKAIKDVVMGLEKTIHGESKLEKADYPRSAPFFITSPFAVVPVLKRTNKKVAELTENLGLLMEQLNLQFVDLPAERTVVSDEEIE